ncbi:uncharacterized protein METZ01_LOCUS174804 [marine metagenome]|uniref:Uncharacterized protein n=1 Tax=marine metagenome TaxID=408172 RepID=A0A382C7C1_9ZZZZ
MRGHPEDDITTRFSRVVLPLRLNSLKTWIKKATVKGGWIHVPEEC